MISIFAFLLLNMEAHSKNSYLNQRLVDYFAGKDEVCLNSDTHKAKQLRWQAVEVKHVLQMHQIFQGSREVFCTVVAEEKGMKRAKEVRYSVSGSRCQELLKANLPKIELGTQKDHICDFKPAP
jgi:hypothetical protein